MFSWNPVFNFIMRIKNSYIRKFGEIGYESLENVSCVERWIEELNDDAAREKIKYLEINQNGTIVLIRYGNFSSASDGQFEITKEDLWEADNGFYLECRSVVIDLESEEIVIAPFRKFRNLNECPQNDISVIRREIENAKSVEITNKLDGSMQCLRYYHGEYFMSGSQTIDPNNSWRLADGLSRLTDNYKVMAKSNPDLTFIFEYIALKDAHVVKYTKDQEGLYLIGIRDVCTGRQYSYKEVGEFANKYGIPTTTVYDKTFDQVLEDVKVITSDEQEGFVISIDGHMIKVKGDDYTQIHRVLSKISSVNLVIKSIAENNIDDLYSKIPEAYKPRVIAVEKVVRDYIKRMETAVDEWYKKCPYHDLKEFMIWVEENVPQKYKLYVRNMKKNVPNDYLRSGSYKCPKYRKLGEMGIKDMKDFFESRGI